MGLSGYLKIKGIDGESKRAEHEDEIDVHGVHWKIEQASSSARGSGRSRSRAQVDSLTCSKQVDASSPYLALACLQGKSIKKVELAVHKASGEAHLDYLVITLKNVRVSRFEMMNDGANDEVLTEQVAFSFENVKFKYTVQADDHSAGTEHEVEFDIAAGV